MKNKNKTKQIAIILTIIVVCYVFVNSIISDNELRYAIEYYDQQKDRVLTYRRIPDYTSLVLNTKMRQYAETRDKYNLLWLHKKGKNTAKSIYGATINHSLILFNWGFVHSKSSNNILDLESPVQSTQVSYDRLVLLKRYNGKWYIEKDVFNYNDKARIMDLLDSRYTDNQIEKYKALLEKINVE